MRKLTAVIVGMGERGRIHLHGLLCNSDEFVVVGICDRRKENLELAKKQYQISENICYHNAEEMLRETNPDVMAFVTMPDIRLSLVELAVKYKVKGLMFEKPMATSLAEAGKIKALCVENGIKTIVCQQHKYLRSFLELKKVLESEEIGTIHRIEASCQPQASQLGTHYIDYLLWAADVAGKTEARRAVSVVGHVHGNFYLSDSHPSPDYVQGEMILDNGIRGWLECGYFSKQYEKHDVGFTHGSGIPAYWTDDRIIVYGTKGYAWASCNGKYGVFSPRTSPEVKEGGYKDFFEQGQYDAQVLYTKEFSDWMQGRCKSHSCRVERAYHGYEILEAMYISAIERTRVDLPLKESLRYDTLAVLKKKLKPVDYRKFNGLEVVAI